MVTISSGFAEVEAGRWLMGRGQPAAFFGAATRRRRAGWVVRDRGRLDLVDVGGREPEASCQAWCADSSRPFLTYIPCAATVFAVSGKVLVAPATAWRGARLVKVIPMNAQSALCATEFAQPGEAPEGREPGGAGQGANPAWVVMATASRTSRVALEEDQTLSVRPEAVVAWTGKSPTGFCRKISIWDVLLPRPPRDLLFTFYGPGVVWIEGAGGRSSEGRMSKFGYPMAGRGYYGV